MSMKDKLKEMQDLLKDWIDEEQKRVTTEIDFLTDLKASEAIAPVADMVGIVEAGIDLDLANLLAEDV